MNDYYEVRLSLTPADPDFCDLLADALGNEGFEAFECVEDGSALTAYVQSALYDAGAVARAAATLPEIFKVDYEARLIEGRDWNAEWENNYFKPIVVADKVVVSSTFHTDVPQADIHILINPKMAFGTGHHATTVLMMTYLLAEQLKGASVVDMGTGTGILAILARKLEASKIAAIEIDGFAVENTAENIELNLGADSAIELIHGDASALRSDMQADIFLANINRNIITADIEAYAVAMRSGGKLTVSGFYVADRPVVRQAAEKAGLTFVDAAELDNWSSMTFVKN